LILIYDIGMVYAAQGKRAEALQILKELEEMSGASLSEAHWIGVGSNPQRPAFRALVEKMFTPN
jgi:hypothetical protein